MLKRFGSVIVGVMIANTCFANPADLETAGKNYRQHKDFASIEIINRTLSKGMPRRNIEKLLGTPDYAPTNGLFYYSTNKTVFDKTHNHKVNIGLIVDYRDKNSNPTETLQNFSIEQIGE